MSNDNNAKFAIRIDHYHFLTKDASKATSFVKVDSSADATVKIIKELKDPNDTHKYTAKGCIEWIQNDLHKCGISLFYNGKETKFNYFHFKNFCKHFNIKDNPKFCYVHKQFSQSQYTYSQQAIEFIMVELKKDPDHILDNIKK